MCIGIPMKVIEGADGMARCKGMGLEREVDTLLVGNHPPGTWLLVFLNSAREVLSETDAERISKAVLAVEQVMQSPGTHAQASDMYSGIDALFPDLVNREPPKPASLLALEAEQAAAKGSTTE